MAHLKYWLPLASLLLNVTACGAQERACKMTATAVEPTMHRALSFGLSEALEDYFPFERTLTWLPEADASLVGKQTRLTLAVALQDNPGVAEVHAVPGPGFDSDEEIPSCSDFVRGDVNVRIRTDDGVLDERMAAEVRIHEQARTLRMLGKTTPIQGTYPASNGSSLEGSFSSTEGVLEFGLTVWNVDKSAGGVLLKFVPFCETYGD